MNKIKDKNKIKVFYNDSCPVCKREIEIYKSRSEGVEYNDSSEMDDKFNRRMHAYQNDVEYKGAEAFLIIWKNTSGFKWLSRLLSNKICIFFMYVESKICFIRRYGILFCFKPLLEAALNSLQRKDTLIFCPIYVMQTNKSKEMDILSRSIPYLCPFFLPRC